MSRCACRLVAFEAVLCEEVVCFPVFFAITERSEMGLYDVSLLDFSIAMMVTSFHVCRMILIFCDYVVCVGEIS